MQAMRHLSSPLLVIAGAGSGKTGVITHKIAYLVNNANYQAKNIFALTFTNKAAKEMQNRSKDLLREKSNGLWIGTFHKLGLEILRQECNLTGLRKNFTVFTEYDCLSIIKDLTKITDNNQAKELKNIISKQKNGQEIEENNELTRIAQIIYPQYQGRLIAYNAVDFDDLLTIPLKLLQENQIINQKWQDKIHYLLIDECQDTNKIQYDLIKILTKNRQAFTAVGDDDQSIYTWRGAVAENITQLQQDYPNLETIVLDQNYRCNQKILNAANQLISNNPHLISKKLWSNITDGEGVVVCKHKNELNEADFVVGDILVKKIKYRLKEKDFAILYRSNFQSRVLEEKLREKNIAYQISGGVSFFEYSEIRDIFSYLRLINNPKDDVAFLRICNTPKRNISDKTIALLGDYASKRNKSLSESANEQGFLSQINQKTKQELAYFIDWINRMTKESYQIPPSELVDKIIDNINYNDHLEKTAKKPEKSLERLSSLKKWFVRLAQENEKYNDLDELIQHLHIMDLLSSQDKQKNAVQLMTLHAAKGLEFPVVYIVGAEEDLIPHKNNAENQQGLEEERRLLYVGMTRAKNNLIISYNENRKKSNEHSIEASRFLDELPEQGIYWADGRYKINQEEKPKKNLLDELLAQDFFK